MSLSKSVKKVVYQSLESYLMELYSNPLRTKSITSGIIFALGNYTSQCISGAQLINRESLVAFGVFGLLFGGSVPHYFFQALEWLVPDHTSMAIVKQLLIQRLLFTPVFQLFTLYTIARLEGKPHRQALHQLIPIYVPILIANWKWLTLLTIINLTVIPSPLRVVFMNLIGFFWSIYLASKRRSTQRRSGGSGQPKPGPRPAQ